MKGYCIAEKAQQYVSEIEAVMPPDAPEGAQQAPTILGMITVVRALIAAIQAGDWMGILRAARDVISMMVDVESPDGVSFALLPSGDWRKKIFAIIGKLLLEFVA